MPTDRLLVHEPTDTVFADIVQLAAYHQDWEAGRDDAEEARASRRVRAVRSAVLDMTGAFAVISTGGAGRVSRGLTPRRFTGAFGKSLLVPTRDEVEADNPEDDHGDEEETGTRRRFVEQDDAE